MKVFLFKVALFSVFVALFYIMLGFMADGNSDPFYIRFTTPRQQSMILGTSRAAQGIQPAVIDAVLQQQYPKMFNFSFVLPQSSYGSVYLNAIEKKLDPSTKNGLFILAVDPWAVSYKADSRNDSSLFSENKLALGNMHFFNSKPNFEYLYKNFSQPLFYLFARKIIKATGNENTYLNKDGWLEVTVKMDSISMEKRIKPKLEEYRVKMLPDYKISSFRLRYLALTIQMLKKHGDVYLVRLPVHPEMLAIENQLSPDFDKIIDGICLKNNVKMINFEDECALYKYTDGNHIYKESGKIVTTKIAEFIKKDKEGFTSEKF